MSATKIFLPLKTPHPALYYITFCKTTGDLILTELQKRAPSTQEANQTRSVVFFIHSELRCISGDWQWDMHCDNVFCSDVMAALPPEFEGTKAIIHPDDLSDVIARLNDFNLESIPYIQFRIITTYGDVKTITGDEVIVTKDMPVPNISSQVLEGKNVLYDFRWKKEADKLELKSELIQFAEQMVDAGIWYHNFSLNETWFSDNVYRLFGLSPQSLNAHLHTFTPFIHPDDAVSAEEAIDRCYRQKLPLDIEYRVAGGDGIERYVQQSISWQFNDKGETILFGAIKDNTHSKYFEYSFNQNKDTIGYERDILQFSEQSTDSATWQINLLTRQVVYSDNYFRLHGIKRNAVPNNLHAFVNFVHADDRDHVLESIRKIFSHHALPEIDYRILTKDGKIKHLRQRARLMVYGNSEMMMAAVVQDVTALKTAERKVARLNNSKLIHEFANVKTQEAAGIGSWIWNLQTDEINWSESMFVIVGMKPGSMQFRESLLLNLILPEDRKIYTDALRITSKEHLESTFEIRILRNGDVHHLKAVFRIIDYKQRKYFIGSLQDITPQLKLLNDLDSRIQLAESLMQNIKDGIMISDLSNNIVVWNNRCEALFHKKADNVVGKNFFEIFPNFKEDTYFNLLNDALKGETTHSTVKSANFGKTLYEVTLRPLLNNADEIWGVLHVMHDITKEHSLREELTNRLQFIEKLLETSVDQVIVLDKNLTFQYWNKAAADYYGLSRKQVINKNLFEVFPSIIHDPHYPDYKKVLKGESVYIRAQVNAIKSHKGFAETFLIPLKNDLNQVTHILSITHDLNKEYELADQQRKAEEIFNTINEAFVELDKHGKFKYVNRKASELWNIDPERLQESSISTVFPAVEGGSLNEAIQKSLHAKVSTRDEFYSATLNKWFRISTTPSDSGVIVLFYDATEEKKTTERLEEEHNMMNEAQMIGQIGSFRWEAKTDTIYWSDETFRIHGLTPHSEVPSLKKILSFTHPDDAGWVNKELLELRKVGKKLDFVHRLVSADEKTKFVKRQLESFVDENNNVAYIIGTIRDTTDQHVVDEKIKQQVKFIERLTVTSPDIIYLLDLNERHVTYSNRQVAEELNYTAEEIAAMKEPFFDLMHMDDIPAMFDHFELVKTAADGEVLEIEYRMKHANGNWCWFVDRNTVFERDKKGVPVVKIGLSENITLKKQRDKEIEELIVELVNSKDVSDIGSWDFDIASKEFVWSEGMYRLFEVKSGTSMSPQIYIDRAIEEDKPIAKRIVKNISQSYKAFEETIRINPSGTVKTLKVKANVLLDPDGKPARVLGVDVKVKSDEPGNG